MQSCDHDPFITYPQETLLPLALNYIVLWQVCKTKQKKPSSLCIWMPHHN